MRMTAVLIFVASGDCDENMEINKFEDDINADYCKIVMLSLEES
jgi:hypothetical protein